MNNLLFTPLLVFTLFFASIAGASSYFASGLIRNYENNASSKPNRSSTDIDTEVHEFMRESFGSLPREFVWRQVSQHSDNTHIHYLYSLHHNDRRIIDHHLKIHYNRSGFIEYASSNLSDSFRVPSQRPSRAWHATITRLVGNRRSRVNSEPVVWLDKTANAGVLARQVSIVAQPLSVRNFIIREDDGVIIEQRKTMRNASVQNAKVWKISPYERASKTSAKTPDTVELTGLDEATKLSNKYFRVRREEDFSDPELVDVNPDPSVSISFSSSPTDYDKQCTGGATDCPNQRMNAINVYYHLELYRERLEAHYATLVTDSPTATKEPLHIIINSFSSIDSDGDGATEDEANNAGYIGEPCVEYDSTIKRCMIFLRPDAIVDKTNACGGGSNEGGGGIVQFYDLAREAVVIVHEYQHFVTDSITALVPGSVSKPNVGDALHEGYSDYFAAAHVTTIAGEDATIIGEYSFQNCPYYQRDLATIREFKNDSSDLDEHVAGLSWASGLWALRKELGAEITDLLALKSLYFLTPTPGFIESVEALIRADKALNNGANAAAIRSIFYDQVKWTGGESVVFRDSSEGIVEVGFHSCSAVHRKRAISFWPSILTIFWTLGLLLGARKLASKKLLIILLVLNTAPLAAEAAKIGAPRKGRWLANATEVQEPVKQHAFRLAPILGAGWLGGTVSSSVSSSGYNLFAGIKNELRVNQVVFHLIPAIQLLQLARSVTISSSSSVTDRSTTDYTQRIFFLTAGLQVSLTISDIEEETLRVGSYGILGGVEGGLPIAAVQTDTIQGETKFTSRDKMLFAVLGIWGKVKALESRDFSGSFEVFYNLGATNSSQILGVRLLIAFDVVVI